MSQLEMWFRDWANKLHDILRTIDTTDPKDLTDAQRFALSVAAGVEFDTSYNGTHLICVLQPCHITYNHETSSWDVVVQQQGKDDDDGTITIERG